MDEARDTVASNNRLDVLFLTETVKSQLKFLVLLDSSIYKVWLDKAAFEAAANFCQDEHEDLGAVITSQFATGLHSLLECFGGVICAELRIHITLVNPLRCVIGLAIETV